MSNLTVADVLERAADLIEPEGAWTQFVFARNADGEETGVSEYRGSPVCWCLIGATEYVAEDDIIISCEADEFLRQMIGADSVSNWNDAPERTQAEVVAALRKAAAAARAVQP